MSLNKNFSSEEFKKEKASQSRPASSNISKKPLPFSANNGARSKVGFVSKNGVPMKNSVPVSSKSGFQKDENFDSLNQRLCKFPSKSVSNPRCLFYSLTEGEVEHGDLSRHEIEQARKTGTLKLCRKGLVKVSDLIWSIELPNEKYDNVIDTSFDGQDDKGWWLYSPLEYLDISHNAIKFLAPKGPALYSLRELHASDNEISDISDDIGQCSALKVLTLHNNHLVTLPKSITKLTNLTELTLQKNFLQHLPDCIGDLIGLRKLDVSSNQLTKIPFDIGYLTAVIELNLSDNQIKSLPEEIQSLRCLTFLDVSNNQLESVPSLNDMSNLTIFSANCNKIKLLPNFYGCNKLQDIRMENNQLKELLIDNLQGVPLSRFMLKKNQISELPEDICRLSTISILDVSDNKLTKLPVQLVLLRNLTQLLVCGNPIEDIRQDILRDSARIISHLKHLSVEAGGVNVLSSGQTVSEYKPVFKKTLDNIPESIRRGVRMTQCLILSNMDLTILSPDILSDLTEEQIFRVDLSRNRFSSVPLGLEILSKNLSEIIIKQNSLTVVPDMIGVMKNLKYLDISNNRVETLPMSMENCNLKELVAEYNCFAEIPPVVFAVKSLERISFSGNKISEINVEGLKSLKYLYALNLSNNNIEKVPPELGHLTQIKELELYGNPFKLPRYSLLCKGTDAVMSYLRDKTAIHDC